MRNVKNISYTLLGMALPMAVTLVTVPLYLSQIGAARYGALAVAWLVLGYVGQADFGMGRALTQRLSSLRSSDVIASQLAVVIWSAAIFALAISILGAIVVYLGTDIFFSAIFQIEAGLGEELEGVALLLGISVPLVNFYSISLGALLGAERIKLVAAFNSLSAVALQIFPLVAAYFVSVDIKTLVASALLARLFFTFPAILACWFIFLKGNPVRGSREEIRNLGKFGSWVMVTSLVGPLMLISDRFLIGAVIGAVAVAAYTIPFQIANRTLMLPYAVMQVMFPRFAAETGQDARRKTRSYMVYMSSIYAVVVISVIALASPLLHLWLGENLDPRSIIITQIIMVGLWANAIAQVPFGFLQARGDPRFTALLHVAELPFYIATLGILGVWLGLPGMAIAFSLRCFADLLALAYRARLLDQKLVRKLLPPAILIVTAFAAIRFWESPFAPYAILITCGGLAVVWSWISLPDDARKKFYGRIWRLRSN